MRFLSVPYLLPLVLLSSCGEKNQNAVELEGLDDDSVSVRLGMVSNSGVRMGGGDQDGMGLLSGNSVSVKVAVSGCKSGYSSTIDTFTAIDQLKIKFYKNDTGCKIKLNAVRLKAAGSSTSADYQMPSGTAESAYAFAGPSPSAQAKVYSATVGTTRKLLVKDALLDLKSNTTPDFRFQAIDGDVTTRSVKNVSQTQSLGSAALEAPNFEIPFDAKFPESANNGLGLSSMGAVYSAGAAGSTEANGGFQLDVLLRCANNVSLGTAGAVNTTAACPTPAGDQMKIHDLQIAAVMCRSTDDKLTFEQVAALFAAVPSSRVMNSPTSLVPVIKSGATFNSTATADYITGLRFKGVKAHFPTAAIAGTSISKGCAFDQSEAAKGWLILRKSEGTGSSAATSYLVTNLELSAASTAAMIATSMKEEVRIFNYTGGLESFKVPNGVTSISIKAWGAGGCVFDETPNYAASHNAEFGGAGGYSAATVSVKAGETVYVEVGQGGRDVSAPASYPNGGAGYNGGCDGGGSSNVYIDGYGKQDKLILVAGGGGGAGWYTPSGSQKQGNGAAGGGLTAQNGGANAGSGGSQTAGGQTGNGKGAALQGGASSGNGGTGGPGGGGGGYFGGASGVGGNNNTNGGGGGGSCYVGPSANGGVLASNAGSTGINDYVDPAGSVRKFADRSFSAAECTSGTGKTPPKTTDPDYVAGIAAGGAIADAKQIPGASTNWKSAAGGNGRVVIRYLMPATQVQTTITASCGTSQGEVSQLGCLHKDGERYLIGVIKQNVLSPTQVAGVINLTDESKVIDDTRWLSIWNRANATTDGNWRLVAQIETAANTWETISAPAANNIHLMKNANRLPLVKSLSAPVLTAYVYSLFHHEDNGNDWMGGDYSGIIYGGTNGYSTFGWYNQAKTNNFFGGQYNYASLKMRLWLYPPASAITATASGSSASFIGFTTGGKYKYAILSDLDTCAFGTMAAPDGIVKLQAQESDNLGVVIESTRNFASKYPVGSKITLNELAKSFTITASDSAKWLWVDANCGNPTGEKVRIELSNDLNAAGNTTANSLSGTYTQSCDSVTLTTAKLTARCRAINGSMNNTVLALPFECVGDIWNNNGSLTCNR
ncbi:MAG: hypothetical protein EBR09_04985 [Proteobacteria bacterium]|nr:hypothetical protein [Pseudomonadota bacterium]